MFRAIVFAIHDAGFVPRCSLELSDATQNRLAKIEGIVAECRYGIHDISRTEPSPAGLPRFNMPFEFGLFLGCKRYGGAEQRSKTCLVLDREQYRYQQFLSDIAGQDIEAHGSDPRKAVQRVRDWLRNASRRSTVPGHLKIWRRYEAFLDDLPVVCEELGHDLEEIPFIDYSEIVLDWLAEKAPRG
jgi:hypothetical protein